MRKTSYEVDMENKKVKFEVELTTDDVYELACNAGRLGMNINELITNMISDLIGNEYSNGSTERCLMNDYFNKLAESSPKTFLMYLSDMGYMSNGKYSYSTKMQDIVDKLNWIEDAKKENDLEEIEYLQEEIDELWELYKADNTVYEAYEDAINSLKKWVNDNKSYLEIMFYD